MDNDSDNILQKQLDAAMPWVGLYIAAASAVCTLAIVADAVNGFRHNKLWFPCKYTSLNAASLTVLAVAMKLPMDLNTVMLKSETDTIAKFTSLTFMSVMMTNFMPSLGSMNDKELLANVTGLGILVITVVGNVFIQFIQLQRFLKPGIVGLFFVMPTVLMVAQLLALVSLAIAASTMKRNLKQKAVLEEEVFDLNYQKLHLLKYWVVAESGSPQFVVARSVVCTAAALICCLSSIIQFLIHRIRGTSLNGPGQSSYGIYTKWIVYIQSIGIAIGVILAMFRWFIAVVFRCSTIQSNNFKIEDYWVQTLKDWRNSFAGLEIRPNICRKYLHDLKWCMLTLCIGIQIFIVFLSKMVVFFSVFVIRPFLLCFSHIRRFTKHTEHASGSDSDADLNLSRYVLLLEGEAELPLRFMKSMRGEADRMIQKGRRKQPSSLLGLLHKSVISNTSRQFNNSAGCWTLSVVTLTSIAISLPNTALHQHRQLLRAVGEGLSLAKIVEKTSDTRSHLKNMREAARVTWAQLLFYSNWLGMDLRRATLTCKTSNEVLKKLSDEAEGIIMEFKRHEQDHSIENPVNMTAKFVAANSMYRICQTICVDDNEEMFERVSVMIADILSDCLTNLPHAIKKMCHQNSIEKRERSVREAFLLLGKTEHLIEFVRAISRSS